MGGGGRRSFQGQRLHSAKHHFEGEPGGGVLYMHMCVGVKAVCLCGEDLCAWICGCVNRK